jgi:voltage-gated sodium channel
MTFIFFTAFAFLNMVIGIVVGVMDEEMHKERLKTEPSMSELQEQMITLQTQIQELLDRQPKIESENINK